MPAHPFQPGAEYLVTAPVGDLPVNSRVIFWRHTYSFYDGVDFYFFATPEAYYQGRPGPDGRLERGHIFSVEQHANDHADWPASLKPTAPPRPGPAWLPQWWEHAQANPRPDPPSSQPPHTPP